jgi:hypothetical protein
LEIDHQKAARFLNDQRCRPPSAVQSPIKRSTGGKSLSQPEAKFRRATSLA